MAGGTSNFPGRPFQLFDTTLVVRQEANNNRSLISYSVGIRKLSYSPTFSDGGAYARWGYDGTVRASRDPGSFDFRAAGPWNWLSGETWVTHNANGTRTIQVNVGADFALLGATSYNYNFALPTISRTPPPAPTPIALDQITRNSMRYRFSSNGTGSSPILRWEFQVSESPAFTGAALRTSSGTSTVTGLTPGTVYYFRSRGVNAAGNGAWSAVLSARTLSGAWISTGTEWVPADVLISNGSAWLPANVDMSDGTTWRPSG